LTKAVKSRFAATTTLVPLQIVEYKTFLLREKDAVSEASFSTFYKETELFDVAKAKGHQTIGVIGEAGIGKTFLTYSLLKHLSQSGSDDVEGSVIPFYFSFKGVNYDKQKTVFRLLIDELLPTWQFDENYDKNLLRNLEKWCKIFILFDGIDEAKEELFFSATEKINIDDHATPHVIIQNILCGRLFPKAMKLVACRSDAFWKLCNERRPQFNVKVLGMSNESQQKLYENLCENNENALPKIKQVVDSNPEISELCRVPMYCELFVKYILKDTSGNTIDRIITPTVVFTEIFCKHVEQYGSSPHMKKVLDLALEGVKTNTFEFKSKDLPEAEQKFLFNFLQAAGNIADTSSQEALCGDKTFSFSHTLFQEFFGAMQLMFFSDPQEFKICLKKAQLSPRSSVLNFAIGFKNESTREKILDLFKENENTNSSLKKFKYLNKMVKDCLVQREYIRTFCWALEANERFTTEIVSKGIPMPYELEDMSAKATIALSYVLRNSSDKKTIKMSRSTKFPEGKLAVLINAIYDSNHEVRVIFSC